MLLTCLKFITSNLLFFKLIVRFLILLILNEFCFVSFVCSLCLDFYISLVSVIMDQSKGIKGCFNKVNEMIFSFLLLNGTIYFTTAYFKVISQISSGFLLNRYSCTTCLTINTSWNYTLMFSF